MQAWPMPDERGIFTFKEEQRTTLKAFLYEKMFLLCSRMALVKVLLNTVMQHSSPRGGDVSDLTPHTRKLALMLTGSTSSEKSDWSTLNVAVRRLVQSVPS